MQYKFDHSFAGLLQSNSDLRNFVAKVEHLEQINQIIASKLEPSLANNCRVANLRDGTLILATTSPAWNHKLRFSSLDLLTALRADPRWSGLKSIEIRVDYLPNTQSASPPEPRKRIPISKASVEIIKDAAKNISNHKLATALDRLSKMLTRS